MIPESDKRSLESLANDIMNLDPRIFSCSIVSNPQGSTMARVSREGSEQIPSFSTRDTEGMAGHWAIRAFNVMERLDVVNTKSRYLVVGRDANKTMIFPLTLSDNYMIIVTIKARTEATEIFEIMMKFIEGSNLILTV